MSDLSALVREIVCNEKIYKIWGHILEDEGVESCKDSPFFDIVEYQKTVYEEEGYDPCQGGFHIGQPWNGDLKGASILFLSSNPGITLNSRCPRYHVKDEKFTWYGQGTEEVSLEGIEDFFNNRFYKELFLEGKNELPSMSVRIKDTKDINGKKIIDEKSNEHPKPYGVPFWNGIRDIARNLLPKEMSVPGDQDKESYIKNVMKHVVSTEIVPFVSMKEKGVNTRVIDKCWDSWTKKILDNSRAPVFILTGAKVKDKFLRILKTHVSPEEKAIAEKAFNYNHPGIYEYRTETRPEPRYVVAVRHPSAYGKYKALPLEKFFSKETLHRLREKIADSVKNAQ